MSIWDGFGKAFTALGKADLMKTNEKLGLNLSGKPGALTEDQLRAQQLELLKQQIADTNATKEANAADWGGVSDDLFGTSPAPLQGHPTGDFWSGGSTSPTPLANKINGVLNPGHEGSLPAAYRAADRDDNAALDTFKTQLGGIKDPTIADYVGDMESQGQFAGADPNDINNQRGALGQLHDLTSTQETAEEKLMREISRRKQGQQLKSDRGAMKNDLQSRGVYGSGAEIGMSLGSQQEAAGRRSLEELGADANAQRRSMDALGKYSDLASTMRGASASESQFRGTAADKAAAFNKGLKMQDDQFRVKQQADLNEATARRAGAQMDASRLTTGGEAARASDIAGKKIQATAGKTGSALAGTQATMTPTQTLGNLFGTQADLKHEEDNGDTPLGSLGIFK